MRTPLLVVAMAAVFLSTGTASGQAAPGREPAPARGPAVPPGMPQPNFIGRAPATLLGPRTALSPDCLAASDLMNDYLQSNMPEQADKILNDYLAAHPDDEKALLFKAVVARTRRENAAPLFEKVVQVRPNSSEGQVAKAMLDVEAGRNLYEAYRTIKANATAGGTLQFTWLRLMAAEKLEMGEELRKTIEELGLNQPQWIAYIHNKNRYRWELADPKARAFQVQWQQQPSGTRGDNAWVWINLARAMESIKLFEDAEEKITAAIRELPREPDAWLVHASILRSMGRYDAAIEKCQKPLELNPSLATAHAIWGNCLEKQDKKEEAAAQYLKAITLIRGGVEVPKPKLLDRPAILALPPQQAAEEVFQYLSAGMQEEAEQILTALGVRFPDQQRIHFMRAVCAINRDVFRASAISRFRQVAQMSDTTLEGRAALLIVAAFEGSNRQQACDDLQTLAAASPADLWLQWLAGAASVELGQYPAGIHAIVKKCHIGPGTALLELSTEGEVNRSLAVWKTLIVTEPAGWTHYNLAQSLTTLSQFKEADEAFALAMPYASFANRWRSWGNTLRFWGKNDQAAEKFARAVEIDPAYALGYSDWGLALEALNKPVEAMEKYEAAIKADPRSPYAYNNAAALLDRQGNTQGAAEMRRRRTTGG